jgi:hypothetical protein
MEVVMGAIEAMHREYQKLMAVFEQLDLVYYLN